MKVLSSGNIALVNGALYWAFESGRARDEKNKLIFAAGYPITPVNEVTEYFGYAMRSLGGAFIQAESEVAAANMVIGAASIGTPAITVTSSPGISLMQEAISYAAGMELGGPGLVYVDVARGGPGLGNIQGSQADFNQAVIGGGHGDYDLLVLAPSSAQEMFDFTRLAFRLSSKYGVPGFILTDGYVGQLKESYEIPQTLRSTAVTKSPAEVRTSIFVREGVLEEHNWKIYKRFQELKKDEELSKIGISEYRLNDPKGDAEMVLVNYGIFSRIGYGVVDRARKAGLPVGQISLKTLNPFPEEALRKIGQKFGPFYVMEGAIGQLSKRLQTVVGPYPVLGSCERPGGTLPEEQEIVDDLAALYKKIHKEEFRKKYDEYWKYLSSGESFCVNRGKRYGRIEINDSSYDAEYRTGMQGKTPEKRQIESMTDKNTYFCSGCDHRHSTEALGKMFDRFKDFDVTLYSPVGCSIFLYDFFKKERIRHIQVPHGRGPAAASGTKRSRPGEIVLCYQGDGDALDIGLGELLHAASRGENFTIVLMNNGTYGMTGGQHSSATPVGQFSKTSPKGRDPEIHGYPIDLSKLLPKEGVGYYRRTLLGTPDANEKFSEYLNQAILHQLSGKGMSVIEVIATCVEHQRLPADKLKTLEAGGKKASPIVAAREYSSNVMSKIYPLNVGWGEDFKNPEEVFKSVKAALAGQHKKETPEAAFEEWKKMIVGLGHALGDAASASQASKNLTFYLCGEGGQGIQSLADVLMRAGKTRFIHNSPWYEPEVTRARTVAAVMLSDNPCLNTNPQVGEVDVLLCLTPRMFFEKRHYLKKGALAVVNAEAEDAEIAEFRKTAYDFELVTVPASTLAHTKVKERRSANMVLLGLANKILKLFSDEAVETAIKTTIPKASEVNIAAYRAGKVEEGISSPCGART